MRHMITTVTDNTKAKSSALVAADTKTASPELTVSQSDWMGTVAGIENNLYTEDSLTGITVDTLQPMAPELSEADPSLMHLIFFGLTLFSQCGPDELSKRIKGWVNTLSELKNLEKEGFLTYDLANYAHTDHSSLAPGLAGVVVGMGMAVVGYHFFHWIRNRHKDLAEQIASNKQFAERINVQRALIENIPINPNDAAPVLYEQWKKFEQFSFEQLIWLEEFEKALQNPEHSLDEGRMLSHFRGLKTAAVVKSSLDSLYTGTVFWADASLATDTLHGFGLPDHGILDASGLIIGGATAGATALYTGVKVRQQEEWKQDSLRYTQLGLQLAVTEFKLSLNKKREEFLTALKTSLESPNNAPFRAHLVTKLDEELAATTKPKTKSSPARTLHANPQPLYDESSEETDELESEDDGWRALENGKDGIELIDIKKVSTSTAHRTSQIQTSAATSSQEIEMTDFSQIADEDTEKTTTEPDDTADELLVDGWRFYKNGKDGVELTDFNPSKPAYRHSDLPLSSCLPEFRTKRAELITQQETVKEDLENRRAVLKAEQLQIVKKHEDFDFKKSDKAVNNVRTITKTAQLALEAKVILGTVFKTAVGHGCIFGAGLFGGAGCGLGAVFGGVGAIPAGLLSGLVGGAIGAAVGAVIGLIYAAIKISFLAVSIYCNAKALTENAAKKTESEYKQYKSFESPQKAVDPPKSIAKSLSTLGIHSSKPASPFIPSPTPAKAFAI